MVASNTHLLRWITYKSALVDGLTLACYLADIWMCCCIVVGYKLAVLAAGGWKGTCFCFYCFSTLILFSFTLYCLCHCCSLLSKVPSQYDLASWWWDIILKQTNILVYVYNTYLCLIIEVLALLFWRRSALFGYSINYIHGATWQAIVTFDLSSMYRALIFVPLK